MELAQYKLNYYYYYIYYWPKLILKQFFAAFLSPKFFNSVPQSRQGMAIPSLIFFKFDSPIPIIENTIIR
jgi:hypothetical protein